MGPAAWRLSLKGFGQGLSLPAATFAGVESYNAPTNSVHGRHSVQVYNDGVFTDADFTSISHIGDSGKRDQVRRLIKHTIYLSPSLSFSWDAGVLEVARQVT